MFRLARAFTGIWSQLRRLNRNIEWIMLNHPTLSASGLPPSTKAVRQAEQDLEEVVPRITPEAEEELAAQAITDRLRRIRDGARPEDLDDDWDFDLFV